MRRLMLLRHAKTENDAPSGRDQDRRLDDRGRRDAAEIGGWIGRHPPFPDSVLVSPAIRAHQTWEIAWAAMKDVVPQPQVEFLPELYGAAPGQLLHTIRAASTGDPRQMMLVGHNPGMHELALALAGSGDRGRKALADNLPTSGLAVFDFAIGDWADVTFRQGRLVSFVSPKLLKETSGK
jgi:phosphohistidine phosphatase